MRSPDPIASPTLARLYMSQGHWVRARAILDEVLVRAPLDGDALALRSRFAPAPRLAATMEDDRLCLRWQGLSDAQPYSLVLALWSGRGPTVRQWVTSRPCTGAFGRHQIPQPWPCGVLVASIGRVDARGYAPRVVAEPLGWG